MYDWWALLFHRPIALIMDSSIPHSASVVAAPILKLCRVTVFGGINACCQSTANDWDEPLLCECRAVLEAEQGTFLPWFCVSTDMPALHSQGSLVPRPHPAFRHLQYGKVGRAWYLFSREHDVIGKWQKFSEQTGCVSCIVQLSTHSALGVYDNRPPLARYMR